MVSTHRCRALLVYITNMELYTDAVILGMIDYDLIIWMHSSASITHQSSVDDGELSSICMETNTLSLWGR